MILIYLLTLIFLYKQPSINKFTTIFIKISKFYDESLKIITNYLFVILHEDKFIIILIKYINF